MVSRVLYMECSGNSYRNTFTTVLDETAGGLNGLVSCAEWTGISLHYLLDEAGLDASATWMVAEGADAAGMNRSEPLSLATSDAMLALYQNGEPLRLDRQIVEVVILNDPLPGVVAKTQLFFQS